MGLKRPYFANFGEELQEKPIAIFEINTLTFVYFQNFMRKQKCLNLELKMPDWVFLGWNLETILSYLKSTPSTKMRNLGKKEPCLGIFGMEFENNIVIFKISTLKFV